MLASLLLALAAAYAPAPDAPFPERVPGMVEDCLIAAVAADMVTLEAEKHKYICVDEPAEQFWAWLEAAKIETTDLDQGDEGQWIGRYFPLGGCFKRVRLADGTAADSGLSCSIWIPRVKGAVPKPDADPTSSPPAG